MLLSIIVYTMPVVSSIEKFKLKYTCLELSFMNNYHLPFLLFSFEFMIRKNFEDCTLVRDSTEEIFIPLNHNLKFNDCIPLVKANLNFTASTIV